MLLLLLVGARASGRLAGPCREGCYTRLLGVSGPNCSRWERGGGARAEGAGLGTAKQALALRPRHSRRGGSTVKSLHARRPGAGLGLGLCLEGRPRTGVAAWELFTVVGGVGPPLDQCLRGSGWVSGGGRPPWARETGADEREAIVAAAPFRRCNLALREGQSKRACGWPEPRTCN